MWQGFSSQQSCGMWDRLHCEVWKDIMWPWHQSQPHDLGARIIDIRKMLQKGPVRKHHTQWYWRIGGKGRLEVKMASPYGPELMKKEKTVTIGVTSQTIDVEENTFTHPYYTNKDQWEAETVYYKLHWGSSLLGSAMGVENKLSPKRRNKEATSTMVSAEIALHVWECWILKLTSSLENKPKNFSPSS